MKIMIRANMFYAHHEKKILTTLYLLGMALLVFSIFLGVITNSFLLIVGPWAVVLSIFSFFFLTNVSLKKHLKFSNDIVGKYAEAYDEIKDRCEKLNENYKKYSSDFNQETKEMAEDEVLPHGEALLSSFQFNAVRGDVAKSVLEFYKNINYNDTLILIKVDHTKACWYIKATGRPIDLKQIKYVMKRANKKIEDFSKSGNSLIKIPKKIYN